MTAPGAGNGSPSSAVTPRAPTVLGALTTQPGRPASPLSLAGRTPFGERTEHFAALSGMARRKGAVFCVFAPAEVDWQAGRVRAAVFRNGRWARQVLPLPRVVYNRLPSREVEAHPLVRRTKDRLQRAGASLFNPGFFDKWANHVILARHASMREHLPETEAFRGPGQVERFLRRFGSVYCKPRTGHAGSGIMRLDASSGRYVLRLLQKGSVRSQAYPRLRSLALAAAQRMSGKPYVVQQTVPVALYRGRAFDFRLLLHKAPVGTWRITGAGIRVAGRGGITTHVPNGGSLAQPKEVLREAFKESLHHPGGVYRRVRNLAAASARLLDQHFGGRLAEMSMDITVSPQGHVWFLEANAKPMRFDEPKIQRRWRIRLLRYALSLAGRRP
ncbi:MAG: YheC/YheD family protein [Bacillota bacterium]